LQLNFWHCNKYEACIAARHGANTSILYINLIADVIFITVNDCVYSSVYSLSFFCCIAHYVKEMLVRTPKQIIRVSLVSPAII